MATNSQKLVIIDTALMVRISPIDMGRGTR